MAAPKTELNPFIRRPFTKRISDAVRYLLRLPHQAWQGFRNWPRQLRILISVLGVIALLAGGATLANKLYQRSQTKKVEAATIELAEAIKTHEPKDKVLALADRVLEIRPDEPQVLIWRKGIESGSCPPQDDKEGLIWHYNVRVYQQEFNKKDQTEEVSARAFENLVRECNRRLEYLKETHRSGDYYAHFLLATLYINKIAVNDKNKETYQAVVIQHLDALGNPEANVINLSPGPAAAAIQLLKELRRDVSKLRTFIASNIPRIVFSQGALDMEPEFQAQLLFLFSETFELPKLPPETGMHWPEAAELCKKCLEGAAKKGDMATLKNLATLSNTFAPGLGKMVAEFQITEEQRVKYAVELENWTRKAWALVIEKEPKNPNAYYGLILSYARTQQNREAEMALRQGLENCGDNPALLGVFSNLTILNDQPMAGYDRLKIAAERNPGMPLYWVLSAKAADKAHRRDLAIEALEKALESAALMPDTSARTASRTEISLMMAAMYTGSGHPAKVLEKLWGLSDRELVAMPQGCAILSRALAEIGDEERLNAFLEEAAKFSKAVNNPQPAYYAAAGASDAYPPTAERYARIAEYLEPICGRLRIEFPPVWQLRGLCMFKDATLRPGPLDPVLARQAANVLESALSLNGDHVPTAAMLLYMRIRGDKDPAKALNEIGPLLSHINDLTAEQVEVLAMVYLANKMYDDALRVLKPFMNTRGSAGCWIQAALGYHGQGRSEEAETALRSASQLPMTDRERADYAAAREQLSRVKQ